MAIDRNLYAAMTNVAWEAVLSGDFLSGIALLTRVIDEHPTHLAYSKRGIAYLLRGQPVQALEDQLASRRLAPQDSTSALLGVSYWNTNDPEKACAHWEGELLRLQNGEAIYADAAGGVQFGLLIWWASAHEGLNHWRECAEFHLRRLRTEEYLQQLGRSVQEWPGPLADFVLGYKAEAEVHEAANVSYKNVSANRESELMFYLGTRQLASGGDNEYKHYLNAVIHSPANLAAEHLLARIEMNDMDTSAALRLFQDIKASSRNPELFRLD